MDLTTLLKHSLDNYEQLEKVNDPAIVMSEYLCSHLPEVCEKCGRKEGCKRLESECPGLLLLVSGLTNRMNAVIDTDYWVGVDLDGTLAEEVKVDENYALTIGKPYPKVIAFVKDLIDSGVKVKIFTPRVSEMEPRHAAAEKAIRKWTKAQFGTPIPSTATRDYLCVTILSVKVKQLVPDTGMTLEAMFVNAQKDLSKARAALLAIDQSVSQFPKS
jgi:hypothetical protein